MSPAFIPSFIISRHLDPLLCHYPFYSFCLCLFVLITFLISFPASMTLDVATPDNRKYLSIYHSIQIRKGYIVEKFSLVLFTIFFTTKHKYLIQIHFIGTWHNYQESLSMGFVTYARLLNVYFAQQSSCLYIFSGNLL